MRLHRVIEINKEAQLLLPMFRTDKTLLFMPHFHNRPNNPLGFAVGLRMGRTGKFLIDAVFITGSAESMTCPAFIFAAVVRIPALDQIGAGFDDLFR